MRHPLTPMFLRTGFLAFALTVGMPMWQQINSYNSGRHPNGHITNDRREYPFAPTGAGLAVMSGLCFLAAAVVNAPRRPDTDAPD